MFIAVPAAERVLFFPSVPWTGILVNRLLKRSYADFGKEWNTQIYTRGEVRLSEGGNDKKGFIILGKRDSFMMTEGKVGPILVKLFPAEMIWEQEGKD